MKYLYLPFAGTLLCLFILTFPARAGTTEETHQNAAQRVPVEEHHEHDNKITTETSDHGDEHRHGENGHEEENPVHLDADQREAAGIRVEALQPKPVPEEIEAPGEVRLNLYATSQVTPRIQAQVVKRHARLGDQVKKKQPLVTLSSTVMAEAQGTLIIAAKEWQRVKRLGQELVSDQVILENRVAYQQAWSKLLAYGMTRDQIDQLTREGDVTHADGSFTLLSPQQGTVIRDEFVIGQMVQPGDLLFQITDESSIWVEAHVNPELMRKVKVGAPARILAGDQWIEGKVVQIHHALEETTRTMSMRLEVPNPGDHLHPGQFVTARIQVGRSEAQALTLPLEAVLRSPDGDWQVFVEKTPGEFEPVEVELVRQLPGIAVIEGLQPGTRVVTRGAFFVQSELAKSGFAVHNH